MNYYLYFSWKGSEFIVNFTHNPVLDKTYLLAEGYHGFQLLSPPVPLAVAHYLWKQVGGCSTELGARAESGSSLGARWRKWIKPLLVPENKKSPMEVFREKRKLVEKNLRRMGLPTTGNPDGGGFYVVALPTADELDKVMRLAAGRLLFTEEVVKAATEQNIITTHEISDILQVLSLQNRLSIVPSVEIIRPGLWRCRRCGQTETVETAPCPVCGLAWCPYCEGCVNMGEARGCRPVYTAPGAAVQQVQQVHYGSAGSDLASGSDLVHGIASGGGPGDFRLRFELTPPQADAARQLEEFIIADSRKEALIWAVCGAGKTEIAFPAIRSVLNRGGRVLLAIPRRDVVLELAPRIREAFPLARLAVLYGGCEQKFVAADITVATTHQVLRYNGCFELVILDEADAYPYRDSAMLHLAVARAAKPGAKKVFMTATPDSRIYTEARNGRIRLITIPARFHGFPLPEPEIIQASVFARSRSYSHNGKVINPLITDWLVEKHHQTGGQVFIFVPTVKLCLETGAVLQRALSGLLPAGRVDVLQYSYAADPERDRKRIGFKQGEFPFLLSTTIMERGITVANAHVLVLFADYVKVFDEGTLIQMAGRAGRSAAFPEGEVLFIGEKVTPAIEGASKKIGLLNRTAAAQGYLRSDNNATIS